MNRDDYPTPYFGFRFFVQHLLMNGLDDYETLKMLGYNVSLFLAYHLLFRSNYMTLYLAITA